MYEAQNSKIKIAVLTLIIHCRNPFTLSNLQSTCPQVFPYTMSVRHLVSNALNTQLYINAYKLWQIFNINKIHVEGKGSLLHYLIHFSICLKYFIILDTPFMHGKEGILWDFPHIGWTQCPSMTNCNMAFTWPNSLSFVATVHQDKVGPFHP